jgi:hypothetical protein
MANRTITKKCVKLGIYVLLIYLLYVVLTGGGIGIEQRMSIVETDEKKLNLLPHYVRISLQKNFVSWVYPFAFYVYRETFPADCRIEINKELSFSVSKNMTNNCDVVNIRIDRVIVNDIDNHLKKVFSISDCDHNLMVISSDSKIVVLKNVFDKSAEYKITVDMRIMYRDGNVSDVTQQINILPKLETIKFCTGYYALHTLFE